MLLLRLKENPLRKYYKVLVLMKYMVSEGPDTMKEKAVKTRWPVVEGTTAGTTKQTGKKYLHPTEGSLVARRKKIGLGDG